MIYKSIKVYTIYSPCKSASLSAKSPLHNFKQLSIYFPQILKRHASLPMPSSIWTAFIALLVVTVVRISHKKKKTNSVRARASQARRL